MDTNSVKLECTVGVYPRLTAASEPLSDRAENSARGTEYPNAPGSGSFLRQQPGGMARDSRRNADLSFLIEERQPSYGVFVTASFFTIDFSSAQMNRIAVVT